MSEQESKGKGKRSRDYKAEYMVSKYGRKALGKAVKVLNPITEAWMRGDRFGEIVAVVERKGHPVSVRVRMDKSGRVLRLDPSRVEAI